MIRAVLIVLILVGFFGLALDYAVHDQWNIAFAALCLGSANAILLN